MGNNLLTFRKLSAHSGYTCTLLTSCVSHKRRGALREFFEIHNTLLDTPLGGTKSFKSINRMSQ